MPASAGDALNLVLSTQIPFEARTYNARAAVLPLLAKWNAPPNGQALASEEGSLPYRISAIGPLPEAVWIELKLTVPSTNINTRLAVGL